MRCSTTLLSAAVLFPFVSGAFASEADFRLRNKTGYQIDEVYVSPHASKHWGKDIMGRGSLSDGEAVSISFPHGGDVCRFDIKVKYHDDDSTAEWGNIDLCKYETISLYWEDDKQVTRAVGE